MEKDCWRASYIIKSQREAKSIAIMNVHLYVLYVVLEFKVTKKKMWPAKIRNVGIKYALLLNE